MSRFCHAHSARTEPLFAVAGLAIDQPILRGDYDARCVPLAAYGTPSTDN